VEEVEKGGGGGGGNVACMGIRTYRVWWGNLRGREHLEDPGVDRIIKLRWISRKWNGGSLDWINLVEVRTDGGCL